MAAITLQIITQAGITFGQQAATASDTVSGVPADDTIYIQALNTNAATATVTINPVSPQSVKINGVGTVAVPAISVVIPALTGNKLIGPISQAYIDATGTVTLLNTGTITNLNLAAIRLPRTT